MYFVESKYFDGDDFHLNAIVKTKKEAETMEQPSFINERRIRKVNLPADPEERFNMAVGVLMDDGMCIEECIADFSVEIIWGDWKHAHLRADYLMEQFGFKAVDEYVTEDDGSDTYSSIHKYEYVGR